MKNTSKLEVWTVNQQMRMEGIRARLSVRSNEHQPPTTTLGEYNTILKFSDHTDLDSTSDEKVKDDK